MGCYPNHKPKTFQSFQIKPLRTDMNSFSSESHPTLSPMKNFPTETKRKAVSGIGVKKMKSYFSPIPYSDLLLYREAFWEYTAQNFTHRNKWAVLRQICESSEMDDDEIKTALSNIGLSMYNNCINLTYDINNNIFFVPNYVINEPGMFVATGFFQDNNLTRDNSLEYYI